MASILVYPTAYVTRHQRVDAIGVVSEEIATRASGTSVRKSRSQRATPRSSERPERTLGSDRRAVSVGAWRLEPDYSSMDARFARLLRAFPYSWLLVPAPRVVVGPDAAWWRRFAPVG